MPKLTARMTVLLPLVMGCPSASVECEDACPEGTSLAAQQTRVDSFQIVDDTCTATCDPITAWPPNIPTFAKKGDETT